MIKNDEELKKYDEELVENDEEFKINDEESVENDEIFLKKRRNNQ